MSKAATKKYTVNRHFHHDGKVYGRLDQPEFTDKAAKEILENQNPPPDGKKILPVIKLITATAPAA